MAYSLCVHAQNLPRVNIGIVSDGVSPRFGQQTDIIKREIVEITRGEFDVVFPEHMQLSGDWDVEKIRRSIEQLFNDDKLDLLIATGPAGSQELISRDSFPKPAIATAVLDVSLQEAPLENGRSGVNNLNYLASPKSFERDLLAFREIVKFKHLAVFVTDAIIELLPQLERKADFASEDYGVEFQLIPTGSSAQEALARLDEKTE